MGSKNEMKYGHWTKMNTGSCYWFSISFSDQKPVKIEIIQFKSQKY